MTQKIRSNLHVKGTSKRFVPPWAVGLLASALLFVAPQPVHAQLSFTVNSPVRYQATTTVTINQTGYYYIEAWGGDGAATYNQTDAARGQSLPIRSYFFLEAGAVLYVQAGEQGKSSTGRNIVNGAVSPGGEGGKGDHFGNGSDGGNSGQKRHTPFIGDGDFAYGGAGGGAASGVLLNGTDVSNLIIASGGGGGQGGSAGAGSGGAGGWNTPHLLTDLSGFQGAGNHNPAPGNGNSFSTASTNGYLNTTSHGVASTATANSGTGGGGGGGGGWDGAVGGGGQSGFADQQTGNNAGGGGAAGKSAVTSASFAKTAAQLPTHLRGSLPSDQSRTSGRRDGEVVITFIGYEYEVYFNDDGGIDGAQTQYPQISPYSFCVHLPTTSSDDYNPHLPATVKAPTKAGYLFEGYFDATNFAGTPFYTFNGTDAQLVTDWLNWNYWDTPVELKAKWTPVDYTVVYESTLHNSGAVPADPNTYTFDGTEPLVLDNTGLLVRNGYAFGGWTPDGETTVYQSGNTLDVNSHPSYIIFDGTDYTVTLTAVWTKVYTVTYEGGEADTGGTPPVDDTQYLRGQKVTVLDNIDYIKSGNWAFGGWSPDGGTTIYQAGQTFPMPDHDVILIAQWVKLYTVTYADGGADGGGVLPVADALFYPGQTVNVYGNSGTLKKTGSRFGGWISNYDAKIYQEGQWFPMPGQDVILTAKWIDEYTVTYVGDGTEDGGNAPEDVYSPYIANETVTVLANIGDNPPSIPPVNPLVKNGYILVGWNDGTNDWIPGQTFPMPAASVTLTARWALACTVTYAANGGSGSVPVDGFNPYAQGAAVKVMSNTLSAPVPGQVFGGWLNSQDSKIYKAGEYFDIGNVDVTLTAQWTTKPFVPVFKYLQDTESVGVEMNLAIIEGWDAELTKFSVNGQIIPGPAYTPITKGTYLIEAFSTTNPTVKIWKYVTVN